MLSDKERFVKNKLQNLFRLDIIFLSTDGALLSDAEEISYKLDALKEILCSQKTELDQLQLIMAEENVYFAIIPLSEMRVCIAGPMGGEFLSKQQRWNFHVHFHRQNREMPIPCFSFFRMKDMISLICFMLSGEMNKDPEIPNFQEGFTDLERYEVIQHQMNNEMANRARYTYQEELQFFQMVENGEVEKIVRILKNEEQSSREDVLQKVGVIARDSDFKQMEYTAVTEIALASRAAIRGNARPDICYDLSDLFLQKISVAKSVTEIYEISKQIAYRFSQEVLREKQERVKNPHVEQCKNYIAKHLYSRFTVEEMAKELSVSRTYLTGLFKKETGQSIRDYIIEHRVRAAANLLRYSNESIGQISDYMQFSSPGRFSQFFKRYYGTTPEIYRKENKMIEFTE